MCDESRLREFFNSLSDKSLFMRFFSPVPYVSHEHLQDIITADNAKGVSILAIIKQDDNEKVIGLGQYFMDDATSNYSAEVSFATSDNYRNNGISSVLLTHLTYLAQNNGILSFTASVLNENQSMIHVLKKAGFTHKATGQGFIELEKVF